MFNTGGWTELPKFRTSEAVVYYGGLIYIYRYARATVKIILTKF